MEHLPENRKYVPLERQMRISAKRIIAFMHFYANQSTAFYFRRYIELKNNQLSICQFRKCLSKFGFSFFKCPENKKGRVWNETRGRQTLLQMSQSVLYLHWKGVWGPNVILYIWMSCTLCICICMVVAYTIIRVMLNIHP